MLDEVNVQDLTPLRFLERSARVFPDKVAIIDGDRRITYRDFKALADGFSRALLASGIGRGDRVAVMLLNRAEMLVAHFAVPAVGALLVALNTRLATAEVAYILQHSQSRLLILDSDLIDHAPAAAGTDWVLLGDAVVEGATSFAAFLDRGTADNIIPSYPAETDPISVNYTSGTTGRPKGVVYTHRGAYLNALGEVITSGITADSQYLWTLPMFHCNGWCCPWAVVAVGGTQVCLPTVRDEPVWAAIKAGATHLNGAPAVLSTVADSPHATALSHRVRITTAAAPPSPTTIAKLHGMGFDLTHVYGLTETYGPYTVCEIQPEWSALPVDQLARKLSRQGVSMVHAGATRVVDAELNDVPADGETIGEIVMHGNGVMSHYLDDEAATAIAFAGGWFHSGDLGVMHPDGYLELRDRKKDIIISGGENISTVEVEQALLDHPAVAEAAVVGAPDEKWQERPVAFVVLRFGAAVGQDELIEHVRTLLARFKAPREIHFLDELPKTSTGKVTKFTLRELV